MQEQLITSTCTLPDPFIRVGGLMLDFADIIESSTLGDICNIINAVKADGPASLIERIKTINDLLPDLDAEEQHQVAEALLCLLKDKILKIETGMAVG